MQQFKFSLEQPEINFLENFQLYGYRDKSSLVRAALEYFQKILEEEQLRQSAQLYAEIYAEEADLHRLTEAAIEGWPEWWSPTTSTMHIFP